MEISDDSRAENTEKIDGSQPDIPTVDGNDSTVTEPQLNSPTSPIPPAIETDDDETVGDTTFETTYSSNSEDNSELDSDSEDDPPKLKYSRINGLPSNFFKTDPISCSHFHEDFFIFATHSGIIHITQTDFSTKRTFKAHRASVLSIYTDGVYFATGSMDGTIVIGSIEDEKDIIAYDFKRPIHAVVLDTNYAKTRSFVSGGMSGKVIHSSKNWLGQRSDVVLDENNGPIVGIHLIDDIVLWMNDKGITVFHTQARQIIKVIERPEDSPRSDLYWPRVHFPEIDRILIGWANYIWCLRVSLRTSDDKETASNKSRILPSAATISFRAVQEKKVEIEHVFKLESLIAGISSFKDDYWMILSYEPPATEGEKIVFNYPDLKLINSLNGEVDFEEEIGLRDIDNLGLNDFSLGRHIGMDKTSYFILSAKDGVIAQEVTLNDRLEWYVGHDKYKEAWEISEHLVFATKRLYYGVSYVDNLVKDDSWKEATEFLKNLLALDDAKLPDGDAKSTIMTEKTTTTSKSSNIGYDEGFVKAVVQQWESWSSIYIQSDHIDLLTEIIPQSTKLSLSSSIYDTIISYWLQQDTAKAIEFIDNWDPELYDYKKIEGLVETHLESSDSSTLRRSLADLYVKTFEPQKAVPHLKKLRDTNIVQFLSKHHLLTNFVSDIPEAIKLRFLQKEYNTLSLDELESKLDDIVKILVEHRHELSVESILKLMEENHLLFINYLYLEELKDVDDFLVINLGDKRVQLYAEFNRSKLLPFLMKNSDYDIDYAIQICESLEYIEEVVYLLGKIGENKKALMLIIEKLDNPEVAINFAKHQNDREAWDILLDYSMSKPSFIKALIETADDQSNPFYDPISIIKRIPNNVKIDGLKASVCKITENNELSYLMNQLILKLIYGRSESISKKYRKDLLKGYEIETQNPEFKRFMDGLQTLLFYSDKVEESPEFKQETEILKRPTKVTPYSDFGMKLEHLEAINSILEHQRE